VPPCPGLSVIESRFKCPALSNWRQHTHPGHHSRLQTSPFSSAQLCSTFHSLSLTLFILSCAPLPVAQPFTRFQTTVLVPIFTMKFTVAIIAAVAAVAAAQSTTTAALSPVQTCLAKCSDTDLNCKAQCVGVPHPNAGQINQTTQCAANCDQGDGSPAATEKYAKCQQACIYSIFLTTGSPATGAPAATGAAGSGSAGSAAGTTTGTAARACKCTSNLVYATVLANIDPAGSGSPSGSASPAGSSGAAVSNVQIGASTVGILGFIMYALAL